MAVVAVLSPYLALAAGLIARKVGEGAATLMGEELYGVVRRKLDADPDAAVRDALRDLEEKPADESAQRALAKVVADKATADREFAEELAEALRRITHGQPVSQGFLTQIYGGEVGKIVNIAEADQITIN